LKWAHDLAAMTQVSMIGFAACGAFLGLSYFDFYWHLVAIMVILDHLVKQEEAVTTRADADVVVPRFGARSLPRTG
jgi:uncharacterized membrane protein